MILVDTGRAVPPAAWVEVFVNKQAEMVNEGLL
jgi:hypothetical protein